MEYAQVIDVWYVALDDVEAEKVSKRLGESLLIDEAVTQVESDTPEAMHPDE